ncbi:MAG: hypothetical protein HY304_05600 [candidate division Zixibacteria bacterium]|nr:hypothetical protein [candidate division Zixibacteria bacterium]
MKSASSRRVLPDLLPRSLGFIDHNVVSGTEYHYTATMTNRLDLESQRADEKSAMPMAFDRRGIMIIHYLGGLHRTELDTTIGLYVDWARFQRLDTIVFAPTPYPSRVYDECSLQRLSHYRLVVIASDVTEGVTPVRPLTDWLSKYLAAGGRCVFITRNLSSPDAMGGIPRHVLGIERTYHENGVYFVPDSSFSHDLHPLHVLFASTQFRGAQAHSASYPDLTVDSARVFNDAVIYSAQLLHLPIYGGGYLTEVGALDSLEAGTEVLYTYEAGVPDTSSLQGLPVAVKRVSDAGQAIMFNFPLWAMADHEAAWHTLSVAAADLGFDTLTAESASTNEVSAMLHWLYGRGSTVPDPLWDVNHDGTVDLLDAIRRIDRLRCPAK